MSFFQPDLKLQRSCNQILAEVDRRFGVSPSQICLTLITYNQPSVLAIAASQPEFLSQPLRGYSHRGAELTYPASIAKLFFLVAYHEWLERKMIQATPETERAIRDMIVNSGNDATGLVVDLLTGTTSGPELAEAPFATWKKQRQIVNRYYQSLGVPAYGSINLCQKVWAEGPYGRERAFYGANLENRNLLTTDATAHLLHHLITGVAVGLASCRAMHSLLARSLQPQDLAADPENQVIGFLGEGLPEGARLWSKAGWMSRVRHDAAYVEKPDGNAFTLVVFSEGAADQVELLPFIGRAIAS
ncbi:MAG: serine hydrolase [Pseudanabaenaceae cyanobacterium bins.68]|nr:serine hydrolase [Pseudanabaenaceae cyanobacterium bins.68]